MSAFLYSEEIHYFVIKPLQARIEVLEQALRKWKCSTCGGRGRRSLGWAETSEEEDPREELSDTPCSACAGTGLAPIARAALAQTGEPT